MQPGKRCCIVEALRGDADFGKVAHQRQQMQVLVGLHAGADHGRYPCIPARKRAHRQHGGAGGSHRGYEGAVHDTDRQAGQRIEQAVGGEVAGQADCQVAFEDVDDLDGQVHALHPGRHGEAVAGPGDVELWSGWIDDLAS